MKYKDTLFRKRFSILSYIAIASGMTMFASGHVDMESRIEQDLDIATPSDAKKDDLPVATSSNASPAKTEEVKPVPKDTFTGFKTNKDGTMYIKNGNPIRDDFFMIGGEIYHFDKDGYMTTGWFLDEESDQWYYFDKDGTSKEGWIEEDDGWYYLERGKYVVGWKLILSDDGEEYWFCFDEDGKMYSDCETPDGYYVNEDGVYVNQEKTPHEYEDGGFEWNKDPQNGKTELSGLEIAGLPAEFYMLCIAGETSGMANASAVKNGDRGCAYGVCQLDYRFDLVDFMRYAYEKHPELWPDFETYLNYRNGNPELKGNDIIGNSFLKAMKTDYETAISDQLGFMAMEYWNSFKQSMNAAGYDLDNRSIAVSAAFFSVNVNCGPQSNIFISNLSPDMTDEELIRGIYNLRNTIFARQKVGSSIKGTSTRYRRSEPQMALDLLYGYVTIDSNVNYGGGVEWHGNPFVDIISTIPNEGEIEYIEETESESETDTESSSEELESETELEESETETEIETEAEQEMSSENCEGMVQLIDGTWVSPAEYGPGFEYMPTEAETEPTKLSDEKGLELDMIESEPPVAENEEAVLETSELDLSMEGTEDIQ